jgi:single-strand DNA-binding protein
VDVNSVHLIGNLTQDPVLRRRGGKEVCDLRIAVSGRGESDSVYVDVTTFDGAARACALFLVKGRQVAVDGRLHYSQWQGDDGSARSRLKVVGNVEFLGPRRGNGGSTPAKPVAA